MELYIQLGNRMMSLTEELLAQWGGGSVILSPRDLDPKHDQLNRLALRVVEQSGEPLLDPQCYLREADHHLLTRYPYWATYKSCATQDLAHGSGPLINDLHALNEALGCSRFILPGLLAEPVDELWFATHAGIAATAADEAGDLEPVATIALSQDSCLDEEQIEAVVEHTASWPVGGYYVVAESASNYLVDQPVWLANLLLLVAGLKLQNRQVIVGYSNHQSLCLSAANADAIASGNYLNARSFGRGKFFTQEPTPSQRATWYYCPQALSEFKIPFLDIAKRLGVLEKMRTGPEFGSPNAAPLFAGAEPSAVAWGETEAFRHYLNCLRAQCGQVNAPSFSEAKQAHEQMLDSAEHLLGELHARGIRGQDRDFADRIDVNRAALAVLEQAYGPRLRRSW